MRTLLCCAGVISALALSGCARDRAAAGRRVSPAATVGLFTNAPVAAPRLIVTPDERLDGTVAWVNSDLRFAVLNFPVGHLPALNQRLDVYRHGLKVGEVEVSGPQRDDNIVADITAGGADVGDEVRAH